jgi:threonylcarbamoyladenosine tRNA methylthiotransferase MtaB
MKYAVITFGCRVNQADSLGFEEELRAAGATSVPPQAADLVIVNTCSVTATADQGARQTIRRVARANPGARIVVTGCYATRRPDELAALPNVTRVVSNADKPRLIPLSRSVRLPTSAPIVVPGATAGRQADREGRNADVDTDPTTADRFGDGDGSCGAAIEPGVAGRTAFTLRVQTGCAQPCSYCIIPTTRGAPRSVPVDDVLAEVERVTAAGFKEVTLTGVHLGSYGRDLDPPSSLLELLRALDKIRLKPDTTYPSAKALDEGRLQPDITSRSAKASAERVLFRISSLEPMDCTGEIVDLVAASARFAPHFHLPLQHASDRVLAAMRRPYTIAQYSALVNDVRAKMPGASIGSDIIVGFPGEADDDFEQLAAYLERAPLTHLHVFPYSDRPGTVASAMRDKVPGTVVRARARRVRELGRRLTERFHDSQMGTTHRALTLEDGSLAVTGNYLKLRIPPGRMRNEWVRVVVTETRDTMRGNLVIG